MPLPSRNATVTSMPSRGVSSKVRSQLTAELTKVLGEVDPGQICAYNQTRECFLGVHVVAGDFTLASFQDWMSTLKPNSGAGMWLAPFRGLPASEVSAPLDLLYIDENSRVIEPVEFFPTYKVSPGSPTAASVLVLPSHSIYASQTQKGDQLVLCPADEVEWRVECLERLATPSAGVPTVSASLPSSPPVKSAFAREEPKAPAGPVLVREMPKPVVDPMPEQQEPVAAVVIPQAPPPPAPQVQSAPLVQPVSQVQPEQLAQPTAQQNAPQTQPTPQAQPEQPVQPQQQLQPEPPPQTEKQQQTAPAKPWLGPSRQAAPSGFAKLGRWLFSEPADPRSNSRKPVPGLVAHFFTGGAPQAHEIRDVSPTGLYVVTTERWYPGTVIRMTLSKPDIGQSPTDRSITIQARAVRWGNDGVGLQFLFEARKGGARQASPLDPIDARQLEEFLKRIVPDTK
jgi:hypothetical protein